MNGNRIVAAGALLMILAVGLGAFGAHGLKGKLAPEQLAIWGTGVEYHFYHALGLLLIGLLEARLGTKAARWSSGLLVVGIGLFSGSLYLLSTKDLSGITDAAAVLGPITPLGGLSFMTGWAVLFVSTFRKTDQR